MSSYTVQHEEVISVFKSRVALITCALSRHFAKHSNKRVPSVCPPNPLHTQTLLDIKHSKDTNHKYLTSSSIRIKASFVLFHWGVSSKISLCSIYWFKEHFSIHFDCFYVLSGAFLNFNSAWRWIFRPFDLLILTITFFKLWKNILPTRCIYPAYTCSNTSLKLCGAHIEWNIQTQDAVFLWLHCYIRCKFSCCLVHHLCTFLQNLSWHIWYPWKLWDLQQK